MPASDAAMKITYKTALELASHEGLVREAYKDSKGVWTWSIGITSASGHSVERYIGKPQTISRCLEVYVWALEKYAEAVRKAFASKPLNEHQFAAAVSFHYNTGGISRASWVKKWLAGDVEGARAAFMSWSKPKEIIDRREKERDLFFDGKWSNDGTVTEYTKVGSNGQINWSSAHRTSIEAEMRSVFGAAKAPLDTSVGEKVILDVLKKNSAPAEVKNEKLVEQVQDLLWDKGYPEVGESDNKFGPRTRNAILAFQADNGLPLTGKITDELLAQLVKAPKRQMADTRQEATAKDLQAEPIVQTGDWLKKGGMTLLGGSLLGGGIDSLDGLNERLTSLQTLTATITGFGPWLIGIAAGGAAIYFGSRVIRKFVEAYREGRAL